MDKFPLDPETYSELGKMAEAQLAATVPIAVLEQGDATSPFPRILGGSSMIFWKARCIGRALKVAE